METARTLWMCLILVIEYIQMGVGLSVATGFGRLDIGEPQPLVGIGLMVTATVVAAIAVSDYQAQRR